MDSQPKTTKNTQIKRIASFGAAMSALAVTPIADAVVMDLTVNPSSVAASTTVFLDVVGTNDVFVSNLSNGAKQFFGNSTYSNGSIAGLRRTVSSTNIGSGGFTANTVLFSAAETGTRILAFITNLGQVGWLRFDLGVGGATAITNFAAAFNDASAAEGGSIHAGEGAAAPEPATTALLGLGLLAMGATGVRRLRRERQAAS